MHKLPLEREEERELVAKSKQGDRQALDLLLRNYERQIRSLARRVCSGLPAEAEDVFQESFLQAFRKIDQYKGKSPFGNWLYRITANLCWQKRRARKRKGEVALPDDVAARGGNSPLRAAENEQLRRHIGKLLEELPPEMRDVLVLSDLESAPGKEIAQRLKISLPAVKSRLHRARRRLREGLAEFYS